MAAARAYLNEAERLVDGLLLDAVKNSTVQVVDDLIRKHAANQNQVTMDDGSLLFEAAKHGSPQQAFEITQLLVKQHGLDPMKVDRHNETALFHAAKLGNGQLCEFLLKEGCNVNHLDTGLQSPIFYAVSNGHAHATEILVKKNADLDIIDMHGFTPIFWAAKSGKAKMMKYLVQMGAKKDHITQAEGDLFTSASGAAIAYSLELGCDPHRILHLNQTNLFVAVQRKDAEKVQLLVETYGLNVNHRDSYGQTCLFYAANLGVVDIMKQLLSTYKADALIEDNYGRTARSYAETHSQHPEKTETLKILAAAEKKQRKVLENAQKKLQVAEAKAEKARQRAAAAAAKEAAKAAEKRSLSSESSGSPKRRKHTTERMEGNEADPRNSTSYWWAMH